MALCVYPGNCYTKNSSKEPDLMWNLDSFASVDMADAWAIPGPINWYSCSINLKLMFDGLVCMKGGNADEKTIGDKNAEEAMALEHTDQRKKMSLNHLEGRAAGFFCCGDEVRMRWTIQADQKFCNIKIIVPQMKRHLKMKEMPMHH